MKKLNRFPKGWDEARVREVLEHYESQTEEEALAEDEAIFRKRNWRPRCHHILTVEIRRCEMKIP